MQQVYQKKVYTVYPEITQEELDIGDHIASELASAWDPANKSYRGTTVLPIGAEDLTTHAKVYAFADKYFVKGLKETVRQKFKECAEDSFKGDKFYEAAHIVFTSTPDTDAGLREVVAKHVYKEKFKYRLTDNHDLRKALKDIPQLAYWMLLHEDTIHRPMQG